MKVLVVLGSLLLLGALKVAEAKTVMYVALKGDECIRTYDVHGDGSIEYMEDYFTGGGVGPLAIDPEKKFLYASVRTTNQFASFHIDPESGALLENNVIQDENNANHISVDPLGRHLLASYNSAGQVAVIDIDSGGRLVQDSAEYIPTGKCSHMAQAVGRYNDVIVPATCSNTIYKFRMNWFGNLERNGSFEAGRGPSWFPGVRAAQPRHFVPHPSLRWIYVSNEGDSSVSRYRYNEFTGALSDEGSTSTLPLTWQFLSFLWPNKVAQIHMTSDGRYLYVSNRGHDSIAGYSIEPLTGSLRSLGWFRTEAEPRAFAISPDDQYLYAAGLGTGKMNTFQIQSSGHLEKTGTYEIGEEPMWVQFLDLGGEPTNARKYADEQEEYDYSTADNYDYAATAEEEQYEHEEYEY